MKKNVLLIIAFAISFQTLAQMFTGNLTLTSQAEIDSFNYTEVTGTLTIEESISGGIINLGGLSELETTGGKLSIINNSSLSSLNGLNNLKEVLGSVIIKDNSNLTSISALNSLTTILYDELLYGGNLLIENNDVLVSLEGLENLQWIPGDLNIIGNDGLLSITSLGNVVIDRHANITNNSKLETMNGLNLDALTLTISNNTLLSSLSNINGIVLNGLIIDNNDSLVDLSGFENLQAGGFFVAGGYIISNNDNLESLNGLSTDFSFVSLVQIENNQKLININVLSDFQNGSLVIKDNDSLTSLNVFSNYLGGIKLIIEGNNLLTDLAGLESVSQLETLRIKNTQLTSVSQLSTYVSCDVLIENNPYINSLDIFTNDVSIGPCNEVGGADIEIINNSGLSSLNGFENVEKFLGDLKILQNENLVDFCHISRMVNNEETNLVYQVQNNQYNPKITDFSDDICNSLGIEEYATNKIMLLPNPTKNIISIVGNMTITKASIYTIQGQKISSHFNEDKIDVRSLSNGMYLLKLTDSENKTQTIRFIKE